VHWVDVVILVIIALSALYGAIRGLIVQVASIVGLLGGLYLAERNYKTVRDFLEVFAHRDRLVTAIAFLAIVLVVWSAGSIIGNLLRGIARFTPLVLVDRLGGLVLGGISGVVAVEVLIILAARSHDVSLHAGLHASHLAPYFRGVVPGLHSLIPGHLRVRG